MPPAWDGPAEDATAAAFAAVGLYGDPTVSWSIYLDVELSEPIAPPVMQSRLNDAVAAHPNCGITPDWGVVDHTDWQRACSDIADRTYELDGALVRGRCTSGGTRLAIAAHHGAMDGLGLAALVAATAGTTLRSGARGISTRPADRPFLRTCLDRAVEAAVRSPRRFQAQHRSPAGGDWTVTLPTHAKISTPLLAAAVTHALEEWGAEPGGRRHPAVLAIAASRRPAGDQLRPDRDTAYLRLVGVPPADVDAAAELLAATPPEPDFPSSRAGGLAPLATRLLQSRLGSTALISNMGRIEGADGIRSMAIMPTAAGPSGVAIGALTVGETALVSLRARRNAFTEGGAHRLLRMIVDAAERLAPQHIRGQ